MIIKLACRSVFLCLLFSLSNIGVAQVEVVTPGLIDRYQLNLTNPEPQPGRYQLLPGSDELVSLGYDVTIGALYLLDNVNKSVELISKTLSGQPVVLEPAPVRSFWAAGTVVPYDASDNFNKIVYVSKDNEIVSGDTDGSYDVFIVDRSKQQTTRVQGRQPHQGNIYNVRISPDSSTLAFESSDWDFGDTSSVTGERAGAFEVVYIYDLSSRTLTTPIVEFNWSSSYGGDETLALAGDLVFSKDGRKLLFTVMGIDEYYPWYDYYHDFYVHNLSTSQTSRVLDEQGDHFSPIGSFTNTQSHLLDQNHILFSAIYENEFFADNQVFVFNFESDSVLKIPAGRHEVQQGQSADGRYVTFYDLPYGTGQSNYRPTYLSVKSGDIWVMDLFTDELKPAFTVNRIAKTRHYIYSGPDINETDCAFFYAVNSDFRQYSLNILPCNYSGPGTDVNVYIQTSKDAYDLSPSDIKFHNKGQYITFQANSWYLDESISYEDFTPQIFDETLPAEFQYIVDRPYTRDTFVVKNPFIDDTINLIGEPVVDRFSETGVYLWQDNSGTTYLEAFAGGSAQGGNSTRFAGSISSSSAITSLMPLSLETGSATPDRLIQVAANQVKFELYVVRPYRDDFSFKAEPGASLCVDLSDFAGGLFLGPDKVEVTPPYDIQSMLGCDNPSIDIEGAPAIDGAVDSGWFIWNDNGVWHNRFVAGGTTHRYQGRITSVSSITNLKQSSIESNDVLSLQPSTRLNFELSVTSPYRDGFSMVIDAGARTCVALDGPDGLSIYLGPDRIKMPRSFDLTTLGDCQGNPNIQTLGKPRIDRTADKGIFLWERAENDWSAEVVSGDTTASVIEIDVVSQQPLSNVEPVGIESNDVFTVLPQQLDLSLRVKAPWYDGFEFSAQVLSRTCVSTPNTAMPIYLGPNRVRVGQSVNLDNQTSCQ